MPNSTHPTLRRLGITLTLIVTFVTVFVLFIAPFLYNARLYYGYYAVGTAVVSGDMVGATRSLQLLYRYRGCIYVIGALVYGGMLGYDAVEGVPESGGKIGDVGDGGHNGKPNREVWTMTQTVEACVCVVLLGYGIVLLCYGWR